MPGKIPRDFIDDLLARIDLVDLIDARVPLKRTGNNYVARCPFHVEKTPSFTVNREKQFYHCFGCEAHGDAIGFLRDYDRLDFAEAVERLAQSVGLAVPKSNEDGIARRETERDAGVSALYEIQENVAKFYARQLREHTHAVDYLKSRGVSGETARDFMIGYAPPAWHTLAACFDKEKLQAAGLVVVKENGDYYDRFRDRIMLPIRNQHGRVVGFGGRILGDATPKYLNSPETAVFKKHKEVYGLYESLKSIAKPDCILVVEGYLDVIALVQGGIKNVVATLGTAPSMEHAALLFRYSDELIFCFDGDAAGRKAAWKALEASLPCLRDGRRLRFLTLPEGHDPDSLVREEGAEAFAARLKHAVSCSDYFFTRLASGLDLHTMEGRAALHQRAKPLIGRLPEGVFRGMMRSRLAELVQHRTVEFSEKKTRDHRSLGERLFRPSNVRLILALLLQHPELARSLDPAMREKIGRLKGGAETLRELLNFLDENPDPSGDAVLAHFRGTPAEKRITALLNWKLPIPPDGIATEFQDAVERLKQQMTRSRLDTLLDKARTAALSPEEKEEMKRLLNGMA